jgi:hypothetical protein
VSSLGTTIMNSPSPSPSTESSGSPPPEDLQEEKPKGIASGILSHLRDANGVLNHLHYGAGAAAASSKRRLPGGSAFGASQNARDAKTRKREREEGGMKRRTGEPAERGASSGVGWSTEKERGPKEDLADVALAEALKKGLRRYWTMCYLSLTDISSAVGDPFDDSAIKSNAQ